MSGELGGEQAWSKQTPKGRFKIHAHPSMEQTTSEGEDGVSGTL